MAKKIPTSTVEDEIASLPNVSRGRAVKWSAEQDRLILKYCPTKGQPAVAAILGVTYETLRRRYKFLLGQK